MRWKVYTHRLGIAAAVVAAAAIACRPTNGPVRVAETRRAMGVPWTITLYAPSGPAGHAALAAAFAEVERLEGILSDYDPASELSRLSAASPMSAAVAVGPDLWRVLERAAAFRDTSDGAFDPTIGPLTTLWRQARKTGRMPRPEKLAAARAAVGPAAIELVAERRAVRLPQPGSRLDLGGIGMGYAADRVLDLLRARGIEAALVDASGDVVAAGHPPGTRGWRVAVVGLARTGGAPPMIDLTDAAVTTSGDAYQAVEIDGVRYSHVIDPRTGLGVTGPSAVTVIAADGTTADALATAASVLGPRDGADVVSRFPGTAARFIWFEDGREREMTTPSWPAPPTHNPAKPFRP